MSSVPLVHTKLDSVEVHVNNQKSVRVSWHTTKSRLEICQVKHRNNNNCMYQYTQPVNSNTWSVIGYGVQGVL